MIRISLCLLLTFVTCVTWTCGAYPSYSSFWNFVKGMAFFYLKEKCIFPLERIYPHKVLHQRYENYKCNNDFCWGHSGRRGPDTNPPYCPNDHSQDLQNRSVKLLSSEQQARLAFLRCNQTIKEIFLWKFSYNSAACIFWKPGGHNHAKFQAPIANSHPMAHLPSAGSATDFIFATRQFALTMHQIKQQEWWYNCLVGIYRWKS